MKATKLEKVRRLKERLTIEFIKDNTCILRHMQGAEEPYDERTVNEITRKLGMWLQHWVEPDLNDITKTIK